jgi:hypothetical protein
VVPGDFTDYVTEDGEKYRIGYVVEYLSRFNLVSEVLDTEPALDLKAVSEAALPDNGPAMKSRRFRNFSESKKVSERHKITM